MVKALVKRLLPPFAMQLLRNVQGEWIYMRWKKRGRPVPPPHIAKQRTISWFNKKYKFNTLVETGTYLGDMVEAQKGNFAQIISIELSEELFKRARHRFRDNNHVTILYGDSGKVLHQVVPGLMKQSLFWLDGHYSGDITALGEKVSPVFEEFDAIFSGPPLNHVILVDDANLFIGTNGYPAADALIRHVKSKNPKYTMMLQNNIMCFSV